MPVCSDCFVSGGGECHGECKQSKKKRKILQIAEFFLTCDDPDHQIEMKWDNAYDGSTKWHKLFDEPSMARYGMFPHQAKYRIKK